MRKPEFDLPGYLDDMFPELSWPGLAPKPGGAFHNWPIAIRFSLNGTTPTAKSRAVAIYETAFLSSDVCVVAAGRFTPDDGTSKGKGELLAFSDKYDIGLKRNLRRKEWWTDIGPAGPGDKGMLNLEWVTLPARSFNYARIIEGVANSDQDQEPRLQSWVYFLAPEKGLLFHMYDNRGLDLAAVERATLAHIYQAFISWIPNDYRDRVDRTFGTIPFRKSSTKRQLPGI